MASPSLNQSPPFAGRTITVGPQTCVGGGLVSRGGSGSRVIGAAFGVEIEQPDNTPAPSTSSSEAAAPMTNP